MVINNLIFNIISSENEKAPIFSFLHYAKIGKLLNVKTPTQPDVSNGSYCNGIVCFQQLPQYKRGK